MEIMAQNRRVVIWGVITGVIFFILLGIYCKLGTRHSRLLGLRQEVIFDRQRLGSISESVLTEKQRELKEYAELWQSHPFASPEEEPPVATTEAYFQLQNLMRQLENLAALKHVVVAESPQFGFLEFIRQGKAWDTAKLQGQWEKIHTLLTLLFQSSQEDLHFISIQRGSGNSQELSRFAHDLFDARKIFPLFPPPQKDSPRFRLQFSCSTDTFRRFLNQLRSIPVVLQWIDVENASISGNPAGPNRKQFTLILEWMDFAVSD
jgi:hypothetical protein